jgi:hypothetical protein
MKQIIVLIALLSVSACAMTPQGSATGQAPSAGDYNPVSGTRNGN